MINKLKTRMGGDRRLAAFTLVEFLIALVVIGVVAAITIPVIMPMVNERVDSYRHSNIVHKVTQATNLMKSLGVLGKFQNTDEFVDVLQKYLSISKRCDSDHLADCWPTEKVIGSDGKEYYVKDRKTRGQLGFKNDKNNPNVGIVLTDGAAIIMTYNSEDEGLNPTDALKATAKTLPMGGGIKEFLEFTTNSTAGLAFLVDVNGAKRPNSETINEKMHDIRNLNGATFSGICGGTKIAGTCYTPIDTYNTVDCSITSGSLTKPANSVYCDNESWYNADRWAGARKACADIGAQLPSSSELRSICQSHKDSLNISSGTYWSSSRYSGGTYAWQVNFNGCGMGGNNRTDNAKVICVSN